MKPIVSQILIALGFAGTLATAGPVSTLYITAGDQQELFLVQGSTVTQEPAVQAEEYALAVRDTVRTLGLGDFFGVVGNEYTLAGTPMAATYTNSFGSQMLDGTTDGVFNYAVQFGSARVVRFGLDWADPTVVATGLDPDTIGITYDTYDGTFWTASRLANTIYHFSSNFALLGSFTAPGGPSGLAFDPADGTLWAIARRTGAGIRLDQYSTSGALLSSFFPLGLQAANPYGAEFALIPEPTTLVLAAFGALSLTILRRRYLARRGCGRGAKRMRIRVPNKPDAANPAMALWLTIEDRRRRVADLER
jgi:DNA-binding beta-propeller fold protein YncE